MDYCSLDTQNPSGKAVESWKSTGIFGIALKEFSLPQMSQHGQWMIATTVNVRLKESNVLPFVI